MYKATNISQLKAAFQQVQGLRTTQPLLIAIGTKNPRLLVEKRYTQ